MKIKLRDNKTPQSLCAGDLKHGEVAVVLSGSWTGDIIQRRTGEKKDGFVVLGQANGFSGDFNASVRILQPGEVLEITE